MSEERLHDELRAELLDLALLLRMHYSSSILEGCQAARELGRLTHTTHLNCALPQRPTTAERTSYANFLTRFAKALNSAQAALENSIEDTEVCRTHWAQLEKCKALTREFATAVHLLFGEDW
jgi:hypothetical protein